MNRKWRDKKYPEDGTHECEDGIDICFFGVLRGVGGDSVKNASTGACVSWTRMGENRGKGYKLKEEGTRVVEENTDEG